MELTAVRSRAMTWLVFVTGVAALYFGRELLTPIALAAYISFLLAPAVSTLHRAGLPRALGAASALIGLAILFAAVGWLLSAQASSFAENLPEYSANLRAKLRAIRESYDGALERASSTVRAFGGELEGDAAAAAAPPTEAGAAAPAGSAFALARSVLGPLSIAGGLAAFVFVLAWIMLLRAEDWRDRLLELAGRSELYVTTRAASEASSKVTAYVRKQLLVNVLHGTALGFVLAWIGVPGPLVWGILAAALRFLPYLGPVISTAAPIVVAFATLEGWAPMWTTAGALLGLELVTNNVVEPLVYGRTTGISPLALLVSAAFWTWVWGPIGLVLSIPLTVCLLVIGKHFPSLHFLEVLIGDQLALPVGARLYHRLLAGEQDGAWDLLRERAKQDGVLAAADQVLVPALALAGAAVREGALDSRQRERIAWLAGSLASELEDARRAEEPPEQRRGLRVLCLSARDAFDAVGTRLLAGELERRGARVTANGEGALLAESLERIQEDPPDVVCISSTAPTHFLQVRALCKKLLQQDAGVHVVLGLWGEDLERAEVEQRLPASACMHVETTLAGAVERVFATGGAPADQAGALDTHGASIKA